MLRDAVAAGGDGLRADDVLVTPGAAAALFATATSLLEPGDHVVVVRTNYATNLETPRAIGADLDVVDLSFDDGWQLDPERIAARVRPGVTRLISVTCPHNPTGTMFDLSTLHALVEIAERSGAVLLVDETYRDLTHGAQLPMAASLSPRAISVASMSKAYGLPGLARRLGGVPRPATSPRRCSAAKEQMVICGATIDEAIAGRVLAARSRILPPILDDVRARLDIVREWMAGAGHVRVDRARGRRRRPGAVPSRRRGRHRAGSTTSCSATTAPTSAPATGSRSTTGTSASASAGRAVPELRAGLTALTDAARTAG